MLHNIVRVLFTMLRETTGYWLGDILIFLDNPFTGYRMSSGYKKAAMILMHYRVILLILLCPWSAAWPGNLIENSSFEAGIDYRFSVGRWYIAGLPSASLDDDSVHGQHSLKYPFSRIAYSRAPKMIDGAVIRASQSIVLEAGGQYTFSLYIKADLPTHGKLVLIADAAGSRQLADKAIRITKKWRRVSLSYTPVTSQNVYWLVRAQSSRPGHIWLDAG